MEILCNYIKTDNNGSFIIFTNHNVKVNHNGNYILM